MADLSLLQYPTLHCLHAQLPALVLQSSEGVMYRPPSPSRPSDVFLFFLTINGTFYFLPIKSIKTSKALSGGRTLVKVRPVMWPVVMDTWIFNLQYKNAIIYKHALRCSDAEVLQ